ncbi:ATP-binding cassette sub-family B member 6-like [Coccinella septempunctata]|uniref:ATP-binding cassette sub-family B member 6-like n=1 Tax=Coccinella septempunctata TaxID=41139 RepID=UPI001D07CA81|nr:ATP-binding cassette sub-family B member 6-like [Coccinella septempunctata]
MKWFALWPSFVNSWKRIEIFLPFIWPRSFQVKIYFVLSFLILALSSAINVYTPIYSKKIVDSLISNNDEEADFRWDLVCIYSLLKYLRSVDDLKRCFWTKVEQNFCKEIEIHVFHHIQKLSVRWHLNRQTGEVLQIMSSSRQSITYLLDLGISTLIPGIIDIVFITGYFTFLFNIWFSTSLCLCLIFYFVFLIVGREKLSKHREEEIEAAYKMKNKSLDSLLNFETVKYFGNEKYEVDSFKKALTKLYDDEFTSMLVSFINRAVENFFLDVSVMIGTLMCVYKVVKTKSLTVGDYVMFGEYFLQLYGVVNTFAYIYSVIREFFTEIESLYILLTEKPEITDCTNAKLLEITGGTIDFRNVFFEYQDKQPILKNISFSVPSGQTVAIVGPSGSGKSTIVRLIFRFYDVISGSILIDGQNIKSVTQESLRRAIGVVPQDTVLFHDTIRYNIAYGDLKASENEIVEAAKAADIHRSIINFRDGYETEVGERGLRLSGGEKQRVAIARIILKAPKIFLLDEATSALDTQTERHIQESLRRVSENRTTLIIAHRLSTIIHADQILVLKEGIIVERGRHEELLEKNGLYASMWRQQLKSENQSTRTIIITE